MRQWDSQLPLFDPACQACPVADCAVRDLAAFACPPVSQQTSARAPLTHRSPQLAELLHQLRDFALPESLPRVPDVRLAAYIPQVDVRTRLGARMPETVGLSLTRFLSRGGNSYSAGIRAARRLRRAGAKLIVLVGTGLDDRLEEVWMRPEQFVDAVRRARIDLILGPAFSIYLGRLPIERACNRARNLAFYRRLAGAGLAAVPAVGFTNAMEARHAGEWVSRVGLSSIFIDLQSADHRWDLVQESVPVFVDAAHSLVRIVVNGVAKPARVLELRELVGSLELVLTNGNSFHLSVSGYDYVRDAGGRYEKTRSLAAKGDIFANLNQFYDLAASVGHTTYRPVPWQTPLIAEPTLFLV